MWSYFRGDPEVRYEAFDLALHFEALAREVASTTIRGRREGAATDIETWCGTLREEFERLLRQAGPEHSYYAEANKARLTEELGRLLLQEGRRRPSP
jgi:hypothetical protein